MKQIIKFTFMAFVVALFMTTCAPKEFDDYQLGESYTITQDQVTFTVTPESDIFTYTLTASIGVDAVKYPFTYEIRYGDGGITKNLSSTHEFVVLAGTYTSELLVYTPNGDIVRKTYDIIISQDNPKFFQDDTESLQFALTGGKDNMEGKDWQLGPWTAMRNPDNRNDVWWDFKDPAILDDVFTFKPNNVKPNGAFVHENNGDSFMNESLGALFPDGDPGGSFVTMFYTPPTNATWEITEEGGKKFLTIDGFFGYAAGPNDLTRTTYEVVSYSPSSIRLVNVSTWDGWCYELTCEEPKEILDLTGGKEAANGKSWMLRPHSQGSGIIMTRTWTGEVWWTIDAGTVGSEAAYDDILTFYAGGKAKIDNHGDSFMNESTAGLFPDGDSSGSFVTTAYVPSDNASWSFTAIDGVSYLKLVNVFPMYAVNPAVLEEGLYEIVVISEDLIHIKFVAGTGEWDVTWNYYLVPAE